jgi:hypothetical protein
MDYFRRPAANALTKQKKGLCEIDRAICGYHALHLLLDMLQAHVTKTFYSLFET